MNWRAIRAIVRKDVSVALRSKFVVLPLVLVPLIIVVAMPLFIGLGVAFLSNVAKDTKELNDIQEMLKSLPPALHSQFDGLSAAQAGVVLFLKYTFAPLYLILPLMTASVIAADSFAGEKERKTLEAVIYTPTTDFELFLAKVLGGWLLGVAVAWISFLLYCVVANGAGWPTLHRIFLPDAMWLLLAFWVAPAAAGMGLGATVIASSRVGSFQEAYQLGGLVVLPVIALLLSQISGVLYLGVGVALAIGTLLWLVDAGLIWLGVRMFRRSEMLAKL